MVEVTCKQCSKLFNAKPSWIKNGYGKFCSRECGHKANRTGKVVTCFICSKEVYKQGKALKGSKSGKFFVQNHVRQNGEILSLLQKNMLIGKVVCTHIEE